MSEENLSVRDERKAVDETEEGEDSRIQDSGRSSDSGHDGRDRVHSEGRQGYRIEAEKIVEQLTCVVANAKTKINIVSCFPDGENNSSTKLFLRLPSLPFFSPGTKVIVFVNYELPFFVGFSLDLFPEVASATRKMSTSKAKSILKNFFLSQEIVSTLAWIMGLLKHDERFNALICELEHLNQEIRKRRMEKTKIKAIRRMVEALD